MKSVSAALILALFVTLISCKDQDKPPVVKNPPGSIKQDSTPAADTNVKPNPYTYPDISPMDMCYFPVDYPKLKMADARITAPLARVIYSRPHLQGRKLFEDIIRYGEKWRLGANESTELDLYHDALIGDKKIKAGRYVLYCVPQKDAWTIHINSNTDSWGLQPDPALDILEYTVPAKIISIHLEYFTMMFEQTATGADLVMAWENTEARLPFRFP